MEVAGKISMGREIENAERADLETAESRAWKNMNIRVFPMLLMRKHSLAAGAQGVGK